MTTLAIDVRQFAQDYLAALSGKPKTEETIDRFVSDPALKEHIVSTEAAFPAYEIVADQIVVDGDTFALRGTFHGKHQGSFAGVPPTGRQVSAPVMVFYRMEDGRIAQFWLQFDAAAAMEQITRA